LMGRGQLVTRSYPRELLVKMFERPGVEPTGQPRRPLQIGTYIKWGDPEVVGPIEAPMLKWVLVGAR
jgi:hypothetical protein